MSCATAASVLEALDRDRYEVVPVGIAKDGHWVLAPDDPAALRLTSEHVPEVSTTAPSVIVPTSGADRTLVVHEPGQPPRTLGEVDVIFPLLHGPFGEDGTLQGLLDLADVRYVGSGVTASATMMDKHVMKVLLASAGLPVGPVRRHHRQGVAPRPGAGRWTPCTPCPGRSSSSPRAPGRAWASPGSPSPRRSRPRSRPRASTTPRSSSRPRCSGARSSAASSRGATPTPTRTSELGECIVVQNHEFYDFEAKYLAADDVRLECPADVPGRHRRADPRDGRRRVRRRRAARGSRGSTSSSPRPARSSSTRSTRCRGSRRARCTRGCGRRRGLSYPELIDELVDLALARRLGLR